MNCAILINLLSRVGARRRIKICEADRKAGGEQKRNPSA